MSISKELAKEYADKPAVLCCRREEGTEISPSDLEDPNILPELESSGLLELSDDCLTIGDVLGANLDETLDSLSPLTKKNVNGYQERKDVSKEDTVEEIKPEKNESDDYVRESNGDLKISIGEGKDINITIPVGMSNSGNKRINNSESNNNPINHNKAPENQNSQSVKEVEMGKITKEYFSIDQVELGSETKIEDNILYIKENIVEDAVEADALVCSIDLEIIPEAKYETYSETIMDVQPIATKVDSKLGEGVTRVIDGVVMVVTGVDEAGNQIGEFGSSEGILKDNIMWNRPGSPDYGDILIKTEVVIKEGSKMERPGPLSAHKASDVITDEIRQALRETEQNPDLTEDLTHNRRKGKKKVVIIKEIMGQGAMHDNLILPDQPVGILGGEPNVDLGNLPVVLSPLEVLDGGIHALTCIGPATKETSRHYWREPIVIEAINDEEIDLAGVVFVGSPQANSEKYYVSRRLGMLIESMDVDGAIIQTEGFGNNHVDFASHHEQVGKRNVPVVGMSFCANQGALVVGNKYMKNMIDLNKSEEGIENEILANNTVCKEDAIRAIQMLKNTMVSIEIKAPEPKFNKHVKENNLELIEEKMNMNIGRVENETSL